MEDDEVIYVSPRPGTNTTIFGGRGRATSGSWEQLNGFQRRILDLIKKYRLAEELRVGPDKLFHV